MTEYVCKDCPYCGVGAFRCAGYSQCGERVISWLQLFSLVLVNNFRCSRMASRDRFHVRGKTNRIFIYFQSTSHRFVKLNRIAIYSLLAICTLSLKTILAHGWWNSVKMVTHWNHSLRLNWCCRGLVCCWRYCCTFKGWVTLGKCRCCLAPFLVICLLNEYFNGFRGNRVFHYSP